MNRVMKQSTNNLLAWKQEGHNTETAANGFGKKDVLRHIIIIYNKT